MYGMAFGSEKAITANHNWAVFLTKLLAVFISARMANRCGPYAVLPAISHSGAKMNRPIHCEKFPKIREKNR